MKGYEFKRFGSFGKLARAAVLWLAGASLFLMSAGAQNAPAVWDTFSDTWVATDGLGRTLPGTEQVGTPRAGKTVGIFYFLWLGESGEAGPYDISEILGKDPSALQNPNSPPWGPLYVPHHWGESIFGYYRNNDEGVLAKHAQMLSDAGVDMVVFDVTNQLTYPRSYTALGQVFERVRQQGGQTPQMAFLCPFWKPKKVVTELYNALYAPGLFSDLWFRWEGKPLILADPALLGENLEVERFDSAVPLKPGQSLGQSFVAEKKVISVGAPFPTWKSAGAAVTLTVQREGPKGEVVKSQRFEQVADNTWLTLRFDTALEPGRYYLEASDAQGKIGWWTQMQDVLPQGDAFADGVALPPVQERTLHVGMVDEEMEKILKFFTFRKPQPDYFQGPSGPEEWGWLEVAPQHAFYKTPGVAEQVTVGVAQNAVEGKLGVLSNPTAHGRSFHDGKEPDPKDRDMTGRNFAEQWERAFQLDPAFVFITGWNEWIAGRYKEDSGFHGAGAVAFVDQFNEEFSRDIEPMKGGHCDHYYYQMVSSIRRFKGVRPLEPVRPSPIQLDGKFDDWAAVGPEFRDRIGDPVRRDHPGWGATLKYSNQTGRNDLVAAKVSYEAETVYFYVRTQAPLTPRTDPNWMLLFLDTDANPKTGWMGYDFVLNRTGGGEGTATLEKCQGNEYKWGDPVAVQLRVAGTELEVAIPKNALGVTAETRWIDFKWADNIQQTGEWSDFTLNGDTAPNDRFNYRALLGGKR
jgi:hypothetical protein